RREVGLEFADIGERVHCLPVEVGRLQSIAVDQAESPDAGAGEIADDGYAQPAAPDDQDAAGAQLRLAAGADFFQRDLPGIVGRGAEGRGRRAAALRERANAVVALGLPGVLVLMRVRVLVPMLDRRRHGGAALAIHPAGVAVLVVLLLPDGHTMFDLIDDVSAGAERLVPVPCADTNPDRHLSNGQVADPMNAGSVLDPKALDRLGNDALPFFHRERLESFVLEVPNAHALIVVAHQPFERGIATASGIGELRPQLGGIDGSATETERSHAV